MRYKASTMMVAHQYQLRNEVHRLSSISGTHTTQLKQARRELIEPCAETGILSRQVTAHEQSAKDVDCRLAYVQYDKDDEW